MAAEKAPAFQFYVRDWLGDARVRSMTLEARAVYVDLLCYCWQETALFNDQQLLARLCGVSLVKFRRLWAQVGPCFQVGSDGMLRHKRLDAERQAQAAYRQRQSEKGKKGAAALHGLGETHGRGYSTGMTVVKPAS